MRVAAGISSELGGSQQATCGIDHRPYMGIPMGVHPADHNRPVDSILVCHVPTLSLAAYNSRSPEPGPAVDRTLKVQKSKLLLGHPAPRFRSSPAGARSTDHDKGTKGQLRGESDPPPPSTPYKYECYEDCSSCVVVIVGELLSDG